VKQTKNVVLSSLNSARFIMERARHISISLSSVPFLFSTKKYFVEISYAMMDGECTPDDWIGLEKRNMVDICSLY
jgi:hypothetical protein